MVAYPFLYGAATELVGIVGISYVLVDIAFSIIDFFF